MIIRDERERYDGTFRLVTYDEDEAGNLVPNLTKSDMDDVIDSFYVQRQEEMQRLHEELVGGRISAVSFFMQLQNMTIRETAVRVGVGQGKVKKHMTPDGFHSASVKNLMRYARVFDVTVADFFQFTKIQGNLDVASEHMNERLLQHVTVSPQRVREGKTE